MNLQLFLFLVSNVIHFSQSWTPGRRDTQVSVCVIRGAIASTENTSKYNSVKSIGQYMYKNYYSESFQFS